MSDCECSFNVKAAALGDPMWSTRPTKREMIFPVGRPPSNDSREWNFNRQALAGLVKEFGQRLEPIPVLYEHGRDASRGSKAAGWVDHLELAEDGLYGYIRYTDAALAEIRAGEWGYRSPGFEAEDEDGLFTPVRLNHVALVNEPAIAGMPPLRAHVLEQAELFAGEPPQKEVAGVEKTEEAEVESEGAVEAKGEGGKTDPLKVLIKIRRAMGLNEDTSVSDIQKALMALFPVAEDPYKEMMMDDAEQKESEAASDVTKVEASAETTDESPPPRITLDAEAEGKEMAARVTRAHDLVTAAVAAGKITHPMVNAMSKFALTDPDEFEEWAKAAPVIAPASGRIVTAAAADRAKVTAKSWSEQQTAVYRLAAAKGISVVEARKQMEG